MTALTMFEKIWARHVVSEEEGEVLLYVDRALIHEGSSHAFARLEAEGRTVARPKQIFAHTDHYVPTTGRERGVEGIANVDIRNMVKNLHAKAAKHGIMLFGIDDPRQGILHIVPPEQGITQPGLLICGADSHTSTHGAFGCLAFGIGASEMMHVMTTQMIWQRKPRTLRVTVEGALSRLVSAKDVILAIICVVMTCIISDAPIPNARQPNAPCVDVCESAPQMRSPGWVMPCSGGTICRMPCRGSSMPKSVMPCFAVFA